MADEVTVKRKVREIFLSVRRPLTVKGVPITTPGQVDPAWKIDLPSPTGMDKTKINAVLVPKLNRYVKRLKKTASFVPGDIKAGMTVGDLSDAVWKKVK